MSSTPAVCLDFLLTGLKVNKRESFLASWHDALTGLLLRAITEPGVDSFGAMVAAVIDLNPNLTQAELRTLIVAYDGEIPASSQYDFRPSWYAALTYAFLRTTT